MVDNVQHVELTVTHFILSSQSLSLSLSIGSSWERLSRHVGVSRYVENVENERRHLDLFESDQCWITMFRSEGTARPYTLYTSYE